MVAMTFNSIAIGVGSDEISTVVRHGWFAAMEDDSGDIRRWLLPRLAGADAGETADDPAGDPADD